MEKDSKINTVDKIIMGILVASADGAEALAVFGLAIPVVGEALSVLAWFYGLIISGIMLFWLIMKGVSVKWFLGGSCIDLNPGINSLTARSAALLATFVEDALPPQAKAVVGAVTKPGLPIK